MNRAQSRSPEKIKYTINNLDASFDKKEAEKIIEAACLGDHNDDGLRVILTQELCKLLRMTVGVAIIE